jgi:NIMA (never in mitosis gene a)-related kinase 7
MFSKIKLCENFLDIKPANILVTANGKVKIGDFGLGRYFSAQTMSAHSLLGTPFYMSPERLREEGYNFASDIWAMGCILYEVKIKTTNLKPFTTICVFS